MRKAQIEASRLAIVTALAAARDGEDGSGEFRAACSARAAAAGDVATGNAAICQAKEFDKF